MRVFNWYIIHFRILLIGWRKLKKLEKRSNFLWQTLYSKSISTRHDGSWHAKEKKKKHKGQWQCLPGHLANISWHNLDHSQRRLITGKRSSVSLHYKLPSTLKPAVAAPRRTARRRWEFFAFLCFFSFSFSAFSLLWLGGNKALYIFREPWHAGKEASSMG